MSESFAGEHVRNFIDNNLLASIISIEGSIHVRFLDMRVMKLHTLKRENIESNNILSRVCLDGESWSELLVNVKQKNETYDFICGRFFGDYTRILLNIFLNTKLELKRNIEPDFLALCIKDIKILTGRFVLRSCLKMFSDQVSLIDESTKFEQFESLKNEFDGFVVPEISYKNLKITKWLDHVPLEFYPEAITRYVQENQKEVEKFLPTASWGPCKKKHRISEKLQKYSEDYLLKGPWVVKKLKDLFRCTLSPEEFLKEDVKERIKSKMINYNIHEESYFSINISIIHDGNIVEIKIGNSSSNNALSHLWYELKRINDYTGLEDYLDRKSVV